MQRNISAMALIPTSSIVAGKSVDISQSSRDKHKCPQFVPSEV
jgi:hypothetical protein